MALTSGAGRLNGKGNGIEDVSSEENNCDKNEQPEIFIQERDTQMVNEKVLDT